MDFSQRFSSESQIEASVTASLNEHSTNIDLAQAKMQELLSLVKDGSIISNNIKRIDEFHLLTIFQAVANLGLRRWAPDVLSGNANSMYNLIHEQIALQTFSQISALYGYSHVGNNLSLVNKFSLI
jgi:hypothetical protein